MHPNSINKAAVDGFTLFHLAAGYLLGERLGPVTVAAGAVLFEVAERQAKRKAPHLFPYPSQDSLANASVDVLAVVVGALLAR